MTEYAAALAGGLLVTITLAASANAQTDGFRIETDVLIEGRKEPIQQTLTLFSEQVAYDISRDDGEITMVDPVRDRIVLINPTKKITTQVAISELERLIASARTQVHEATLLGASKIAADADGVSVGDDLLKYEATIQEPPSLEMAEEYRKFADALAMLNSWSAYAVPPFSRLALNEAILKQKAIPQKIVRTKNSQVVECLLHSTWILSRKDASRIADIGKKLVSFERVETAEYQKRTHPTQVAATPDSNQPK